MRAFLKLLLMALAEVVLCVEKMAFYAVLTILGHVLCFVVTLKSFFITPPKKNKNKIMIKQYKNFI